MKRVAALAALATVALGACSDSRYARLLPDASESVPAPRPLPSAVTAEGVGRVPLPMPRYATGDGIDRVSPLAARGFDRIPATGPAESAMASEAVPAEPSNSPSNGVADSAIPRVPQSQAPQADELIGLAPPALRDLMGTPALRRVEGPARVWQYRDGACVLDVFFEAAEVRPAVTHVEARTPAGRAADRDRCYAGLIARGLKAAPARAATGLAGDGR